MAKSFPTGGNRAKKASIVTACSSSSFASALDQAVSTARNCVDSGARSIAARSAPNAASCLPHLLLAFANRYQWARPAPSASLRAPSSYRSAAYKSKPAKAHLSAKARQVAASCNQAFASGGAPPALLLNAPTCRFAVYNFSKVALAVAACFSASAFFSAEPLRSASVRLQSSYARASKNRRSAFENSGTPPFSANRKIKAAACPC
mmetsp:Transcript_22262/g.66528  ORF Transcript_22262/g.66528 Transcript_22262/m.66528 type:complete len:206 (-) Transcript_22262:693-1310(-)